MAPFLAPADHGQAVVGPAARGYASFVIAITIPATTNTTTAI
jgi:hypothetical protein